MREDPRAAVAMSKVDAGHAARVAAAMGRLTESHVETLTTEARSGGAVERKRLARQLAAGDDTVAFAVDRKLARLLALAGAAR
jgi:hypothetical protein